MSDKKYFAFISYQSNDVEWVKWLEHELDFYHLPSNLSPDERTRNGEIIRDNLRDVFWDGRLEAGGLNDAIKSKLESSANLIVICSPNSANVKEHPWVNEEIEYFIRLGRLEHIFPFIVEGNEPKDFFPPALLNLPKEKERVGGNVNKDGKDAAFVKIVAGMLDVDVDVLWQHYEREKAEQERKEREEKEQLQIIQSRYVAEKAMTTIDGGDSYLARRLAIEILPKDIKKPDRPVVVEAEKMLRDSKKANNAILKGHTDSAIVSIFSKDGLRIFSLGADGCFCVWNATNGALIHRSLVCDGYGKSLCLSPDGGTILVSIGYEVLLLDAITYICKYEPIIFSTDNLQIAYSSDGKYIFVAFLDGTIKIFDEKCKYIMEFRDNNNEDFKDIAWISVSDKNRIFASTWESLNIWDFCNEKITYAGNISLPVGRISMMKFSSNGKYMVSSKGRYVYIWDVASYNSVNKTYRLLFNPLCHNGDVYAIDISPDGKTIAVGADNRLYLWTCEIYDDSSLNLCNNIKSLGFNAIVDYVCYNNENDIIVVSLNNCEVRIIDLKESVPIKLHIPSNSLAFSPDENFFAVVSNGNYAPMLYNVGNYEKKHSLQDDENSQISSFLCQNRVHLWNSFVVFHENGKTLLSMGASIDEWDVETMTLLKNYEMKQVEKYSCCFKIVSRNGKYAIFAYKNGSIFLFNTNNYEPIKQIEMGEECTLYSVASFSHDSKCFATTSEKGNARIWDSNTGDLICELPTPSGYMGYSIEFSNDGTLIISANQNHHAIIWKWDKEKNNAEIHSILDEPVAGRINYASFNNNGNMAVTASLETIVVWDVQSGKILKVINCPFEKKFVCFSPDSRRIFSSDGNYIYVWDFPTLQELIDETRLRFGSRVLTKEERKQYYLD